MTTPPDDLQPSPPPSPQPSPRPRSRRPIVIAVVTLVAVVLATGVMLARRARRDARAEELLIVQGVRKVCKLATVEIALADYSRRTVPKPVDLPLTTPRFAF